MTFHLQSKNRNKIKRDIGRHILNDFELQHKEKRNLKSNPSYHLLKMALIKSATDTSAYGKNFVGGGLNIIYPNETCWSQMHKMILS